MLKRLTIKNFAIIEDADIFFKDGLTVLTGETGAGKSLLIDSIELLLGERANLEMIRNGEDKATITGIFSFKNSRLSSYLSSLDIYHEDEITISRIISLNKSVVKINDKTISLNELKNIAKYLADIHQQFDMVKLLNKDNYLDIVDGIRYELVNDYLNKYLDSLTLLKEKENAYNNLKAKIENIKKERENYEYSLNELKMLNLSPNEEEEISSRIELLKHYDQIYEIMGENKEYIDKDSLSDIYHIKENLEKLIKYQNEYQETYNKLNDYYYEIEAIYDELKRKFNHLDYSPEELDELETRRNDIALMKKKYHKSVEELIEYQNELEQLLKSDEDLNESLKEAKHDFVKAYKETYQLGLDLSNVRKEIAKTIEKELIKSLNELALKVNFVIDFKVAKADEMNTSIFTPQGLDEIDFMIETNVGEGLKPLAKVISGGEMSRIMLAFKALFIKSHKISTVIFDEADTGISGEVAQKVALLIKKISLSTQVIAITHLPQLASLSNNHIKVSKSVIKDRTYTNIKELTLDEKIYEIASMISGGKVTEKQLEYAKELVMNQDY